MRLVRFVEREQVYLLDHGASLQQAWWRPILGVNDRAQEPLVLLATLGDGTDIFRRRLAVAWGGITAELDGRGGELAAQVLQKP